MDSSFSRAASNGIAALDDGLVDVLLDGLGTRLTLGELAVSVQSSFVRLPIRFSQHRSCLSRFLPQVENFLAQTVFV